MRKVLADKWIDIGALILAALALWFSYLSYQAATGANELSQDANAVALQANEKSDTANELSEEANEVAHGANELSQDANELSQEANELARAAMEESLPRVEVVSRDYIEHRPTYIDGCRSSFSPFYVIRRNFFDTLTFTNRGGRTASLLEVNFYEDDIAYWDTNVYEVPTSYAESERNQLPVDIAPGTGEIWGFSAYMNESYATKEEASQVIESLQEDTPFRWTFRFSDGVEISKVYTQTWYTVSPYLDFDRECP